MRILMDTFYFREEITILLHPCHILLKLLRGRMLIEALGVSATSHIYNTLQYILSIGDLVSFCYLLRTGGIRIFRLVPTLLKPLSII
jgi:hypothetical protein